MLEDKTANPYRISHAVKIFFKVKAKYVFIHRKSALQEISEVVLYRERKWYHRKLDLQRNKGHQK